VLDRLQLDVRPPFWRTQDDVVRVIRIIGGADLTPQRLTPESRLSIKVICPAVDDQSAKAAPVHMFYLQTMYQMMAPGL
jgi:hypothetical protein